MVLGSGPCAALCRGTCGNGVDGGPSMSTSYPTASLTQAVHTSLTTHPGLGYDGPDQHATTRKLRTMPKTLHRQTTVMPGGKIVIVDQDLAEGETIDVFVTKSPPTTQRSAMDILAEAPGHRIFETEDAVNDYLESERESWER